ncbi:hypothetical protein V6M85_05435 [Sulfolobus tengchongensis]|uniref:Uncharacterized protein n=1 Tax=Sulfolobus tengchongensis TaxID=207809 RepID=A0AAX4L3K8_9CREN
MKLIELIETVRYYKETLDIEKIKEEDRRVRELIEELEKTKEDVKDFLKKLLILEKKSRELGSYEEKIDDLKEDIKRLYELDSAEEIIKLAEKIKNRIENLEKDINMELDKILAEKIKNIEQINERLKLFAKILLHLLKIPKEVRTFNIPTDKSLSKLNEIEKQARQHMEELYNIIVNELKKINLNETEVNLLIELIDKGEIRVNRENADIIAKIIKMLIDKNIVIKVKI